MLANIIGAKHNFYHQISDFYSSLVTFIVVYISENKVICNKLATSYTFERVICNCNELYTGRIQEFPVAQLYSFFYSIGENFLTDQVNAIGNFALDCKRKFHCYFP